MRCYLPLSVLAFAWSCQAFAPVTMPAGLRTRAANTVRCAPDARRARSAWVPAAGPPPPPRRPPRAHVASRARRAWVPAAPPPPPTASTRSSCCTRRRCCCRCAGRLGACWGAAWAAIAAGRGYERRSRTHRHGLGEAARTPLGIGRDRFHDRVQVRARGPCLRAARRVRARPPQGVFAAGMPPLDPQSERGERRRGAQGTQ